MLIYKITNTLNGKCYIGYTKTNITTRWQRHVKELNKGTNRKLYDAMRKYGVKNFTIEEIDRDDTATQEEWLHLETLYIIVYDAVDYGYNMTYGGMGGNTISGRSMTGKTYYDKWVKEFGPETASLMKKEMYEKIGEKNKKYPPHTIWTDEQKNAMSIMAKEKGWRPPITRRIGKDHPMYGKSHNIDTKIKLSNARKGKVYEECMPQETAAKLREFHRNQFLGEHNPNYIDIPKDELYDLLINKKLNVIETAKHFKASRQTIIDKTKKYFGATPSLLRKQYENKT